MSEKPLPDEDVEDLENTLFGGPVHECAMANLPDQDLRITLGEVATLSATIQEPGKKQVIAWQINFCPFCGVDLRK